MYFEALKMQQLRLGVLFFDSVKKHLVLYTLLSQKQGQSQFYISQGQRPNSLDPKSVEISFKNRV